MPVGRVTTPGRVILSGIVPGDMKGMLDTPMDKKALKSFFGTLARDHPDEYEEVMHRMAHEANEADTLYGRWASISLKDLKPPPKVVAYRDEIRREIRAVTQNPKMTPERIGRRVVEITRRHIEPMRRMLVEEGVKEGNALAYSTKYGFRGNPLQLAQMLVGDMLIADNDGKPIPMPILRGYSEGLSPIETFAGSYGARQGAQSVQFNTAQTGYLAKQLRLLASGQVIEADDCGTDAGVEMSPSSDDAVGRVLAVATGGLDAGSVLGEGDLRKLRAKSIVVRSPRTCQLPYGVCRKCAGKRPDGKWPGKGEYLGFEVAGLASEPLTQRMALNAKHTGGSVGTTDVNKHGFDEINQFLQVPDNFAGAVHTAVDGMVRKVDKAPQGGLDVTVEDEIYHLPPGREVSVKPGDKVWAGDTLSDGTPNPKTLATHKGIGAGREYVGRKLAEILKGNGVGTAQSNVDTLARSFIANLKVTNPDGVAGFNFGEIVPYDVMRSRWTPRKDARETEVKRAAGLYLEKPALHYTIGTRLTPEVLKELERRKVARVTTHTVEPGFQPHVVRVAARTVENPDWKHRMAGFYLKKAYEDMATHGASDEPFGQPSAFAGLMDPARMRGPES